MMLKTPMQGYRTSLKGWGRRAFEAIAVWEQDAFSQEAVEIRGADVGMQGDLESCGCTRPRGSQSQSVTSCVSFARTPQFSREPMPRDTGCLMTRSSPLESFVALIAPHLLLRQFASRSGLNLSRPSQAERVAHGSRSTGRRGTGRSSPFLSRRRRRECLPR